MALISKRLYCRHSIASPGKAYVFRIDPCWQNLLELCIAKELVRFADLDSFSSQISVKNNICPLQPLFSPDPIWQQVYLPNYKRQLHRPDTEVINSVTLPSALPHLWQFLVSLMLVLTKYERTLHFYSFSCLPWMLCIVAIFLVRTGTTSIFILTLLVAKRVVYNLWTYLLSNLDVFLYPDVFWSSSYARSSQNNSDRVTELASRL